MAWVVDTSVLLDIRLNDAVFGAASAACITRHLPAGLVVCPVTYIELAPMFRGNSALQQNFLNRLGVSFQQSWHWQDTLAANELWNGHVAAKRAGKIGKRLVADVMIEAFARRFEGLITRNPKDFSSVQTVVPG